jgi:hypothetical protein
VLFALGFFVMSRRRYAAMVGTNSPKPGNRQDPGVSSEPVGTVIVGFMGDHLGLRQAIVESLKLLLCVPDHQTA